MKKILILSFLIVIILLLPSCAMKEIDSIDRLSPPDNIKPPIDGKWILTSLLNADSEFDENHDNLLGKEGLFHKDAVIIAMDYTTNPSYKVKLVKSIDYLLYKYKLKPEDLGIDKDELQIITILSDNQYFNEFIKVEEDLLIVNIEDEFYKMEQISEQVSLEETMRYIDIEKAMIRNPNSPDAEKRESGLMLGLKIPSFDNINQLADWKYQTIWIRAKDSNIQELYTLDKLILPRSKGFWEVEIDRRLENSYVLDSISLISNRNSEDLDEEGDSKVSNYNPYTSSSILKNIVYLGNNYISIEEIIAKDDDKRTINIFSIDNLQNEKPLKLSYFIGDEGRDLFFEGAQNVISLEEAISMNEANISLVRNKGYWIFNGRVNYIQNEKELFKDFNIRAIPPKDLVNYDEKVISWEAVKRKVPDAIDMLTSPNKEFILVVTNYNIQIYSIENNDSLSQNAIRKFNLPKNTKIVMSEWAMGRYVEGWEKEIIDRGGKPIEE